MTYVGATPTTGDFKKLDAITTSSTATYNLRQGSVAVYPQSANHCIVSLNGVIQAPVDAFTIVNDTIVFASSLASSDAIDFILVLGNVNDIGTVSDDTVSTAKLQANAVTGAKFNADVISAQTALAETPATTDEMLISDAGVLKRVDMKHMMLSPVFAVEKSAAQTIATDTTTKVTFDTEIYDPDNTFGSNKFTPAVSGYYLLSAQVGISNMGDAKYNQVLLYKNGSSLNSKPMTIIVGSNTQDLYSRFTYPIVSDADDYFEVYVRHDNGNDRSLTYNQQTNFHGFKILGAGS